MTIITNVDYLHLFSIKDKRGFCQRLADIYCYVRTDIYSAAGVTVCKVTWEQKLPGLSSAVACLLFSTGMYNPEGQTICFLHCSDISNQYGAWYGPVLNKHFMNTLNE